MDRTEIEANIRRLNDQLAEVIEEKNFVLSQTGRHVPGHVAREYEATIKRLEKELAEWRQLLAREEEKSR